MADPCYFPSKHNVLIRIYQIFKGVCPDAFGFSQEKIRFNNEEIQINPDLKGTLYSPLAKSKTSNLVILIAGSGPTDRNGNQFGVVNNSLKFLAEALAANAISVFSYDKRIFAAMKSGNLDESKLSFLDFIEDAKTVVSYFKNQKKYATITIAGHSEGALIGMVAAQENATACISLAGAGRPIDEVLLEQIEKQAPFLLEEVRSNLNSLKNGETFELKNQMLASLFRPSVQPYMISWIKFNPQNEIKKLAIPTLIIQGDKDLQIKQLDASLLLKSKPDAQLKIIPNMNHIFKDCTGDEAANRASYTNPDLPVSKELIQTITEFIHALKM